MSPFLRALLSAWLIVTFAPRLPAQSSATQQSLYWIGYFATVELTDRWYAVGEFQERRWTDPVRVHQRVWRGHLHRRLGPSLALGGGFTYFLQGAQSPESPPLPLVAELRPHVQLDLRQRLAPRVSLAHRARLEYRARPRTEDGLATGGYESAGRLRYRLGVDLRLGALGDRSPVLRLSDELHLMFGDRPADRPFDQNRVQAGLVLPLTAPLTMEVAYLWWYQHTRDGRVVDRDILRLVFHHRLRRVRS